MYSGFIVHVNERKLEQHEYRGVTNNSLFIRPPKKMQDDERGFYLNISKLSAMETIRRGMNPRDGLFEKLILDAVILYPKKRKSNHLEKYHRMNVTFSSLLGTGNDRRVTNRD